MKAAFAKMPILGWGLALHHGVFIRSRPDGRTNAKVLASETSADAASMPVVVYQLKVDEGIVSLLKYV